MNGTEWVSQRTFDRVDVPAAYPYNARVARLLAWESADGFWRWQWGYEPDGYDTYWQPRGSGVAAVERIAQKQCRDHFANRDRGEWTAPSWAMDGER